MAFFVSYFGEAHSFWWCTGNMVKVNNYTKSGPFNLACFCLHTLQKVVSTHIKLSTVFETYLSDKFARSTGRVYLAMCMLYHAGWMMGPCIVLISKVERKCIQISRKSNKNLC